MGLIFVLLAKAITFDFVLLGFIFMADVASEGGFSD